MAGYGALWLPPVGKAEGGQSVGYDVFDRLQLDGRVPRKAGQLKPVIDEARSISISRWQRPVEENATVLLTRYCN
jgi:hypothetical protein